MYFLSIAWMVLAALSLITDEPVTMTLTAISSIFYVGAKLTDEIRKAINPDAD